jgi:hypothetical protein
LENPVLLAWFFLDSLVRIETFQWVMQHKRALLFLTSSWRSKRRTGGARPCGSTGFSSRKITPISNFLQ